MILNTVLPKMIKDETTLLLLHGEDFTDSSIYKQSITNNGVTVSTAQSKFGGSSLYFNRSSYISMPPTDFESNNFTIDWWEYTTDGNIGARFSSVFCENFLHKLEVY